MVCEIFLGLWPLHNQFINVIITWLAKILKNITCGYGHHLWKYWIYHSWPSATRDKSNIFTRDDHNHAWYFSIFFASHILISHSTIVVDNGTWQFTKLTNYEIIVYGWQKILENITSGYGHHEWKYWIYHEWPKAMTDKSNIFTSDDQNHEFFPVIISTSKYLFFCFAAIL